MVQTMRTKTASMALPHASMGTAHSLHGIP